MRSRVGPPILTVRESVPGDEREVARALVQHLERIGSDSGCRAVTLYTVRETGNVSIFERMGFRVESEEPARLFESRSRQTLSEVMMRKTLAEGAAR